MSEKRGRSRGPMAVASALLVGLLISGFTVWSASEAAFHDRTSNTTNTFSSGQVLLSTNGAAVTDPMFSSAVEKIGPGAPLNRCITVKYNGDIEVAQNTRLYGDSTLINAAGFEKDITLTVQRGTITGAPASGVTDFSCPGGGGSAFTSAATIYSGTLANFHTTHTSYATALDTGWRPTLAAPNQGFRFTVTIANNDALSNQTVAQALPFYWELYAA